MTDFSFDKNLDRYAELTVKVGINLQPGQRLLINAPLLSAPFTRLVARHAYRIGAQYVDVTWVDEQMKLIRLQHAPRSTFEEYPTYLAEGWTKHAQDGGAALGITSEDPDLLADQDPDDIATIEKTRMKHLDEFYNLLGNNCFNWSMVSYPTPAWAKKVLPDLSPREQESQLWEAIFQICRINEADPTSAWQSHIATLKARAKYMTAKQYAVLQFLGSGTNLTIGLAEQHRWNGGGERTRGGVFFTGNLPTEEIYCLPHRERIDGHVSASMPLNRSGALVEDFSLHFEHGHVTQVEARQGKELLQNLIAIDDGMGSLGEVALVPYSSPISQMGILFYNTLLDENAASHIALGDGLKFCLQDAEKVSELEYAARGGNKSINHIDFMIGSPQMDVDGIYTNGSREPVMRSGEWAFDV